MPEEIAEKKGGKIEEILNEMKAEGIGGALARKDGVIIHSTIALPDIAPGLITRCANISEAIMARMKNSQKEIEIAFANGTIVAVPMKNYIFYGIAKSKDEKRKVLEYSKKAGSVI
ncbi:hypothetical protein H0O02_04760 [Candidatus Micrarchaeota archaeon]|nr:hypothetical protein [Candidatus Micrarchaeota archaeon]